MPPGFNNNSVINPISYDDIVPPGFNNNIIINPVSGTPRPRSPNPSAMSFYPENFLSQCDYEKPSCIENDVNCGFIDSDFSRIMME